MSVNASTSNHSNSQKIDLKNRLTVNIIDQSSLDQTHLQQRNFKYVAIIRDFVYICWLLRKRNDKLAL